MIGAIAGDIIGSVYEFDNIKTEDFKLFHPDADITDDSIMTLAIAKAILESEDMNGDILEDVFKTNCIRYMKFFGIIYPFPMGGYGARFSQWLKSTTREPYDSYGNGAAMRVSACAWAAKTLEEAENLAEISSSVTHNHPYGIAGARATAAAIKMALDGRSKEEIKDYIAEFYYPEIRDMNVEEIRKTYKFDGSCPGTVPQALTAFFESNGFEDAIRKGVSLGGDSDTLCAITGSVAEAYYGVSIPMYASCRSYLPDDLLRILKDFEGRYGAMINADS